MGFLSLIFYAFFIVILPVDPLQREQQHCFFEAESSGISLDILSRFALKSFVPDFDRKGFPLQSGLERSTNSYIIKTNFTKINLDVNNKLYQMATIVLFRVK